MCGIAGIFDLSGGRPIDRTLLAQMNMALEHRGPDDSGYFFAPGIGLAHRRLSIIDLSGGHQPLFNEDESVCVVYNGEIYNFHELSDELIAKGHRFRTRCDTEVIVHAWEEWGPACVERFRGMFAFAIYDARQDCLFLARDRLGIKPLYYAKLANGSVIFASELKALLKHPELKRDLDPIAIEEYFALGYVPDPRSIYKSVAKLAPGHTACISKGDTEIRASQYWDMAFEPDAALSLDEGAAQLREIMNQAVSMRMIADVPLGAFLSGGVDSSAVVAAMAQAQSSPVNTCSIAFGEKDYDESAYAEMVARRYGCNHHSRVVSPDDYELLLRLPQIYDEPFADSSALPTYRVCEEARRHVTVALSGDGGDEVFAGYRRYRWFHYEELVRRRLPQFIRGPLFGLAGGLYPKLDWAPQPLRAKSTLLALAKTSARGYFDSVSILTDDVRKGLYSDRFKRELQGYRAVELIEHYMKEAPTDDHLSRAQYVDMKTYLPGDILTKVDRASMAHSLEVRVPLLDHKFVEWSGKVRSDHKLRGREGKYIFKKALENDLPADILYRPKMGFAVPLAQWFRGPLKEPLREAVFSQILLDTGIFDPGSLHRMFDQHVSGARDHSQALWALLMFSGFLSQVHNHNVVKSHLQIA